jgi:hypothetical protein
MGCQAGFRAAIRVPLVPVGTAYAIVVACALQQLSESLLVAEATVALKFSTRRYEG